MPLMSRLYYLCSRDDCCGLTNIGENVSVGRSMTIREYRMPNLRIAVRRFEPEEVKSRKEGLLRARDDAFVSRHVRDDDRQGSRR